MRIIRQLGKQGPKAPWMGVKDYIPFMQGRRGEYKAKGRSIADDQLNNDLVNQRDAFVDRLPERFQNDATRQVVDWGQDVRDMPWGLGAAGAGAVAFTGGMLGARQLQEADGEPTTPLSTSGRLVNQFTGWEGPGVDTYADIRNDMAKAHEFLGNSEEITMAVAQDTVNAAAVPEQDDFNRQFQSEVMQVAGQLLEIPDQTADGPRPMSGSTAIARANEIVTAQWRAEGLL